MIHLAQEKILWISAQEMLRLKIRNGASQLILAQESRLREKESFLRLSSPEYILAKGYSITLKNGKAVKSAKELLQGDSIETVLAEGKVKSVVISDRWQVTGDER